MTRARPMSSPLASASFAYRLLFVGVFLLCFGCASVTFVDAEGNTHVLGLVKLKIEPASVQPEYRHAGTRLSVSGIGISLLQAADSSALAIGYTSDQITLLDANTCFVDWTAGLVEEHSIFYGGSK